ncbi:MAG TPA: hypothetical protein VG324_04055, partial [Blastocatellia bacterium]|nr:hypothetical protein [Blastocatellia bacterium]
MPHWIARRMSRHWIGDELKRHKVRPLRIEREDFGLDAFTIQNRFQVLNHNAFIARRIAGIQAQYRLEVAHGF